MKQATKKLLKLFPAAAAVWSIVVAGQGAVQAQPSVPAATDAGLLDAVNGYVDRLDRVFDYQMAPDFDVADLYGKKLALSEFSGRIVVITFVDQKNEEEAKDWLSEQSIDYMGDPDIAFVNVLYPGRIPFIVSRGNAVDSIRKEVDRYLEEMWQGFSDKERDAFQKTTIRWIVDWKRDLQRAYNTTRDRVNIVVVDRQGRIRQIIRTKTSKTVEQLRAAVTELKADKGQAGVAQK